MKSLGLVYMSIILMILCFGCSQGTPSEDPPVHLNPNMDDQPKYEAMEESKFFLNRSAMRMPVDGTVARGQLNDDPLYYQGKDDKGKFISKNPLTINRQLLRHGQERYNIYCTPCHGLSGYGQGIVVKKGFLPPPSFHIDRLRKIEDGYVFNVITNGIRNMPAYRAQIPVADRWAIVAYFRALQRSQNATIEDIPQEIKGTLK